MDYALEKFPDVSQRRVCKVLGQPRSTQRKEPKIPDDEERLVQDMTRLATEYGRYGYRMITKFLRDEGWWGQSQAYRASVEA